MGFNLVNQLTQEDRAKIENYIHEYGTKKNFIGIDSWLQYWSANKIKMYKLLGNQFIYRIPFEYHKSEEELNQQIHDLIYNEDFPNAFKKWLDKNERILTADVIMYMANCLSRYALMQDRNDGSLKFKLEDEKKTLQFQNGIKPIRALGRFLTYCKNLDGVTELSNLFEKFRLTHSVVFNDKVVKGHMVISIHPLDFMTMSDNNSKWESCMSWKSDGCYHVGTVEMMNSNNVLCCYLENSAPYYFSEDNAGNENYKWCNKKWRQLVYFTKDIIVCGKSYPYANDEISKSLIKIIRDLARKNLGWTYSFGPELYQDMKWINGSYSMNRAKRYISYKNMRKHNILFDTKGMYNDMLNDSYTHYWCVRNKVNHNKIISYIGKAPCLCCGESVIYSNDYDYYDENCYNERYRNTGATVCESCLEDFKCDFCESREPDRKHYKIQLEDEFNTCIDVCEDCFDSYFRKCPDCGRTMFVTTLYGIYNPFRDNDIETLEIFIKLNSEIDEDELSYSSYALKENNIHKSFKSIFPIYKCSHCIKKDSQFELKTITTGTGWSKRERKVYLTKEIARKADWEKYFLYKLEHTFPCDGEVVTN